MPIPPEFTEATDRKTLDIAIDQFGKAEVVTEDDLCAALRAVNHWRDCITHADDFDYKDKRITWYGYEWLIWHLGESFRQIMFRNKKLRRNERVFERVQALCLEPRFGKGRESFTMLLGRYGGASQIPVLVRLLGDPQVCGHAVYGLRLLGASEAADKVRPFLNSPKAWIRQEAGKYFEKIEATTKK